MSVLVRATIIANRLMEFLPDARPLFFLVGPPGSGKTSLARAIGMVACPNTFTVTNVPESERDFWTQLARTNPVVLDNVERATKWFLDALASATSGASRVARKLYTDSELICLRAQGLVFVTSFSGGSVRGDLLDRSIVIRLGIPSERVADGYIKHRIEARRAEIEAEFKMVTDAVRRRVAEKGCPSAPPAGSGRNADFAILGHLISEVVGGEHDARLFDAAMAAMPVERVAMACDAEALLAAVIDWAVNPSNDDGSGRGIWITASALVTFIAGVLGGTDSFKSTTGDANRLGRFLSELSRMAAGLLMVETRTVRGIREYRVTALFDRTLLADMTAKRVD